MQRYIGTKVVLAGPMTRQEYNNYRGWQLPSNENGADEGYLVEYEPDGKPNVEGHQGYVSWSPKEQFDKAYRPRPANKLIPAHQQRVLDERAELDEKASKLWDFLGTPTFGLLDKAERHRLHKQYAAMQMYSDILGERIAAF
jgi:hypothetical protein